MKTPDTPCTPADRAAIVAAAQTQRDHLMSLVFFLCSPRWERMSQDAKATIRAEAAQALRWVAE